MNKLSTDTVIPPHRDRRTMLWFSFRSIGFLQFLDFVYLSDNWWLADSTQAGISSGHCFHRCSGRHCCLCQHSTWHSRCRSSWQSRRPWIWGRWLHCCGLPCRLWSRWRWKRVIEKRPHIHHPHDHQNWAGPHPSLWCKIENHPEKNKSNISVA